MYKMYVCLKCNFEPVFFDDISRITQNDGVSGSLPARLLGTVKLLNKLKTDPQVTLLFVFCVNYADLWSQTFITESVNVTPCIVGLLIKICLSVDTNCKPRTLCYYSELRRYALIRFKMRMTFLPTT
jgi:hypothetical protein